MDSVREIPLFNKLSEEHFRQLEHFSYFKTYNAGEIVFYEGDDPGTLYILVDGVLRLYKTDPKGHEFYIHQFVPVSLVGELACFENMKYPATARFITSGKILKIDYKRLENDFFKNPDICFEIIKSLTRKVKILSNVIHQEMILTSDAKVAKFIINHFDIFNSLKNNEVASILNITPETLSRTLAKFKKQRWIEQPRHANTKILNKAALKKLFEE